MNIFVYWGVIVSIGACGMTQLALKKHSARAVRVGIKIVWASMVVSILNMILSKGLASSMWMGLKIDNLSLTMSILILLISGIVHLFSLRYMDGDSNCGKYFANLAFITANSLLLVIAGNVYLFFVCWVVNQVLLATLMTHKSEWKQAQEGGRLFLKSSVAGSLFFLVGLVILSYNTSSVSIQEICIKAETIHRGYKCIAFICILISAMVQSGIFPLHRWLISSLNSPTPVSAFMHAGLVSGGGFLFSRLSSFIMSEPLFLDLIFTIGVISVVYGSIWKLMQSNVKKMLACSTMAQMGFMFVQCGLGLFPAAIAHMCWHGLFKGFLFLNSGSGIQARAHLDHSKKVSEVLYCLLSSLLGGLCFAWSGNIELVLSKSQVVLIFFATTACFYVTLSSFGANKKMGFVFAPMASMIFGTMYGSSILIIEKILSQMHFWSPQPLKVLHVCSMLIVIFLTLVINHLPEKWKRTDLWKRYYVKMLNLSQSNKNTITTLRNEYKF